MKLMGNTKKKIRRAKRRSPAAAIIGSLLGLFVLAAAAYSLWESPPGQNKTGLLRPDATTPPTASGASETGGEPDRGDQGAAGHNDAVYTFLVAGRDKVGANTDTILVGSLDTDAHTIDVVSIPRDTLVNTPCNVKKVNVLYDYDLNGGGNGMDGLLEGIRDLLGFYVDFYALVDLEAFEKLVDAIGGVYYDVPVDMYYEDPDQDLHIAIPAGYQWLSGAEALKVVRFRAGYASADIGRIGTQQDFLKSVAAQMLKLGNIPNLAKISDIFTKYVETDLTASNISFLAREFLLCSQEDIQFHTLPGNYGDSVGGFSYVSLYLDEWLEMVNTCLNPWDEDVTAENVNILTRVNGKLTATTGVIAGGEGSFLTMDDYLASLNKGTGGGSGGEIPESAPPAGDEAEAGDGGAFPGEDESDPTAGDGVSPGEDEDGSDAGGGEPTEPPFTAVS